MKITNLCIFQVVLVIFEALNIHFVLSRPLLHQNVIYTVINFHEFTGGTLHTCRMQLSSLQMALASLSPSRRTYSFLPCLSILVPVIDIDPQCRPTVTKLLSNLSFKISFLFCPAAVRCSLRRGFERRRQQRKKCHLEGGNIHKAEPKTCMYQDILLVIFVLSTYELVQNTHNFIHVVEKKVENGKLVQVWLSLLLCNVAM